MTEGEKMYHDLRAKALAMAPQDPSVPGVANPSRVYGVVMDWGINNGRVVTLAAFPTDEASIYFSNGGGVIGAARHDDTVRAATRQLLGEANLVAAKAEAGLATESPSDDQTHFNLLSDSGPLHVRGTTESFQAPQSPFRGLYYQAHRLILCIRNVEQRLTRAAPPEG